MEDTKKLYLFEQAPVHRAVLSMAVPTVISSLVMVIYNLVDTYFVSMLNNPVENSAVTLAAPVILAFNAVNNLFGVGSTSLMSRSLGTKEYDKVRKTSSFGFYCSVFFGLFFTFAYFAFNGTMLGLLGADETTLAATNQYMLWTVGFGAVPAIVNVVMAYMVRSEGSTLHASIGTMSGCLLNILLDPIFILPQGLDMGAAGAGLATFLSNCAACIYFFAFLFIKRGKTYVCIKPTMFKPSAAVMLGVFSVGIPAAIQNLLNVIGMTILNNFTSSFGADAVAAMGISQKINMVPLYIALGSSQGIMPLVSYNYADGNRKRMKNVILFSAKIMIILMITASAVYFVFAGTLTTAFIKNTQVVAYGTKFLRGMCLALPFLCTDFLAVGVFQATGMGGKAFVFALLRKVVLEIPALFILNSLFPLYGLAYAQTAAEIILAAAAVIVLTKILKNSK